VVDFAGQFVRLEVENAQLREAAKSSSDQLQEAKRLAADAQNENMNLKEELKTLKMKLKEERDLKLKAYAEADKKEGVLRESIESLPSKIPLLCFSSSFKIFIIMTYISH
jgi:predicted  nucleic acid-binding Zn-ribbon protein